MSQTVRIDWKHILSRVRVSVRPSNFLYAKKIQNIRELRVAHGCLYPPQYYPRPSHRRRGATAVLVRHKPQWHRHDRRGSAVIPSLIAVAPRKTVKTADLRAVTAETLNIFKTFAVPPRVGPIRSGVAAAPSWPPWHRTRTAVAPPSPPCPPQYHLHHRRASAVQPPCNRENVDWRPYGDPVSVLLRLNVCRVGRNYWRCHYGDGGFDQKP